MQSRQPRIEQATTLPTPLKFIIYAGLIAGGIGLVVLVLKAVPKD